MSGVEIGLAVLPLILSVGTLYQNVAKIVSRYKSCASELQKLHAMLITQRTIYDNEVRQLITNTVGKQRADEMLHDINHASWANKAVEDDLVQYLGPSLEACKGTVEMIQESLQGLSANLQHFDSPENVSWCSSKHVVI